MYVLLFQKVSVSGTLIKSLMTKIREMGNRVWLLQDLSVSDHVISPTLVGVIINPGWTDTRFYFQSGLGLVANCIFSAN